MHYAFGDYLFNPMLRDATWGTLLLGTASGILGSLLSLRRSCLMAETMSHASYPGLMVGVLLLCHFVPQASSSLNDAFIFAGAWLGAMVGLLFYSWSLRQGISSDSALCWVLSSFLGLGVLMASQLQLQAPRLYQRAQTFLYGQAATLNRDHLLLFGTLLGLSLLTLLLSYRQLLVGHLDPLYARTQGHYPKWLRLWIHLLTSALVVTGTRAGGVLVMGALLVAPAVAARMLSRSLVEMLGWSMLLGGSIACTGNWLSLELDAAASSGHSLLPTGPAIALVGCLVALVTAVIAPKRGYLARRLQLYRLQKEWLRQIRDR